MHTRRQAPDDHSTSASPIEGLTPAEARARLEQAFSGQRRRRLLGWPAILSAWLLAAGYYWLTPVSYVSKWTLILPVANSSSSVSLDTIGQTSTTPGQTFGSVSLSPKVIYKEIVDSEQVRRAAAASIGLEVSKYGRARVRLIDETSLMLFQIGGRSPDEAQKKAQALIAAFNQQLDVLRRDEVERRGAIVRESLKHYQASLDATRERILELQRSSGLLSINQFNEAVSSTELIRRKLADLRSELQKLTSQQAVLVDRIGVRPAAAAAGLKLAADPSFARLATAYAESNTQLHEHGRMFGPGHPARTTQLLKLDGAIAELEQLAGRIGVDVGEDLRRLVLLANSSHQADLLHALVANEAQIEGRRREIATLEGEVGRLDAEVQRMSGVAARLEYLKKDHLLAEAIYTSAAARLDINRTDLYSSYPMVQVLAEPDLPMERSQPQLLLAIVGGLAGTILILMAWGAAWFRASFGRRR